MDVIQPPSSQNFRNRIHHKTYYLSKSRKFLTLQYTSPITHLPLLSPLMPLSAILVLLLILMHLSFSNHISNLSRPPLLHAQPVTSIRRIRPMLDSKTASTIATSIVYSKLDSCNSLFLNLDSNQNLIQRLQLIQNSLARVVTIERPGISSY